MKILKEQSDNSVIVERKIRNAYDHIWDAIPYYELLNLAVRESEKCGTRSEAEVRKCAEATVRANICHCFLDADGIIASISDDFVSKLMAMNNKGNKVVLA